MLVAAGLLPLISLLILMFVITLPFTGLNVISHYTFTVGLLLTLTFLQLILMIIVLDPQKASLPWAGPLRCPIKTTLLVALLYMFAAAWALQLRVVQHGWTADHSQGALVVLMLLVQSLGYFASIIWRRG